MAGSTCVCLRGAQAWPAKCLIVVAVLHRLAILLPLLFSMQLRVQAGVPDGQGTLRQSDGCVRSGQWKCGQLVHGSVRGADGDTVHTSDAGVVSGTFRPRPVGSQILLWALGLTHLAQVRCSVARAHANRV